MSVFKINLFCSDTPLPFERQVDANQVNFCANYQKMDLRKKQIEIANFRPHHRFSRARDGRGAGVRLHFLDSEPDPDLGFLN